MSLLSNGGEGGIRTLGTGVSPYNGLAKGSFSPPSLVFKGLTVGLNTSKSGSVPLIRQLLCSALCSALCSTLSAAIRSNRSACGEISLCKYYPRTIDHK